MNKTSERLQQIMREQNLKQADIIERAKPFMEEYGAKLTRHDISQYYHGKVKPTQEKLFLLAAALNVNEAWLMGYDVPLSSIKKSPFRPLKTSVLKGFLFYITSFQKWLKY